MNIASATTFQDSKYPFYIFFTIFYQPSWLYFIENALFYAGQCKCESYSDDAIQDNKKANSSINFICDIYSRPRFFE